MLFELLRWWYGPGWMLAFRRISVRTQNVAMAFSVPILLRTLFSPWKRIVTSGAKSLDAKFRAAIDNLVSRTVGFTVRCLVLITAAIMTGGTFAGSIFIAVVWPLVPLLIIYCLIRTFV
jgi:hypothetical protein